MDLVEQVFGLKKCITLTSDQEDIGLTVRKGVFGPQLKYVVDGSNTI